MKKQGKLIIHFKQVKGTLCSTDLNENYDVLKETHQKIFESMNNGEKVIRISGANAENIYPVDNIAFTQLKEIK